MRKFFVSAMAALTFSGAALAAATPAEAQRYHGHHRYYGHHRGGGGNDVAVAAVAGIAGLALGAALADNNRAHGSAYYSGRSYPYRGAYSYDPRYDSYRGGYDRDRVCVTRERVWDPYIGRHVRIERQYPC